MKSPVASRYNNLTKIARLRMVTNIVKVKISEAFQVWCQKWAVATRTNERLRSDIKVRLRSDDCYQGWRDVQRSDRKEYKIYD